MSSGTVRFSLVNVTENTGTEGPQHSLPLFVAESSVLESYPPPVRFAFAGPTYEARSGKHVTVMVIKFPGFRVQG